MSIALNYAHHPLSILSKVRVMASPPSSIKLVIFSGILPELSPHQAYLVGGSVRDLLLGRKPMDADIVVTENAEEFADRMAQPFAGRIVKLGKPGLMIYRVVTPSIIFDISKMNGPSIEDDLLRRDFTVNAMAVDLASGEIIDVLDGGRDLAAGRIRMVSESVFSRDPVRLVRAFRLATQYRFEITPQTLSAVSAQSALIAESAGERIRAELLKILESKRSAFTVGQMASSGLLEAALPEMACLRQQIRKGFSSPDLFGRNLEALTRFEDLLAAPDKIAPTDSGPLRSWMAETPVALLKFALLLHAADGSNVRRVQSACRRLKMSKRQSNYIDFIVRHHQRPFSLFYARRGKHLSGGAVARFFTVCGNKAPDLLLLAAADAAADGVEFGSDKEAFFGFVTDLLERYFGEIVPLLQTPPLLTGHDLIASLGMVPSSLFGMLLERIRTERLAGTLRTKEEAIQRVKDILGRP